MLPFAVIRSSSTGYDFYITGRNVIVSGKYLFLITEHSVVVSGKLSPVQPYWSELYTDSLELFFCQPTD